MSNKQTKTVSVVATTSFAMNVDGVDRHFVPDTPYELDPAVVAQAPHLFLKADEWLKGRKPA